MGLGAWSLLLVRIALVVIVLGEVYVTATVQLPGLMHPTASGTDASNYDAAGQRLNDGHNLYGPLLPGDRPVPRYPGAFPAPLLSPPLVAVMWRPLAVFGDPSMTIWWAIDLALVVGACVALAARGQRWTLGGLLVLLALGWPIARLLSEPFHYLGYESPISIAALSGNLNGYLTALLLVVWWATNTGRRRLAGIAAGLAAVLKLGPFVLAWWFVVRRDWPAVKAFVATVIVLGIVGLLGAGLAANLGFARLTLGAGITPTPLSIPGILNTWLGMDLHRAGGGTIVATILGLAVIYATGRNARISFLVAILVVIYSSPVVLTGNFVLLLAALGPGAGPGRVGAAAGSGPTSVTAYAAATRLPAPRLTRP